MRRLAILGSTGSIGTQTLDVVRRHPGEFEVVALAAREPERLAAQVAEWRPRYAALGDGEPTPGLLSAVRGAGCRLAVGAAGLAEVAAQAPAEVVVVAVVGAAGLAPAVAAIEAGRDVALATKEVLVMAGALVTDLARRKGARLVPIDSEHSALWQCLVGEHEGSIRRLILTCSGGPFRGRSRADLRGVTVEQALRHPNWRMGQKITIDSATLMNKGFEVLEARWLFDVPLERVDVVVHPQSVVHSMVELCDGSLKAQLGTPDMRLPIQYALSAPRRLPADFAPFDLSRLVTLTFEPVDTETFPCFSLAYRAGRAGGTAPAVLNGADEAAVALFLEGRIAFLDVAALIEAALAAHQPVAEPTLAQVLAADEWAKGYVRDLAAARR